MVPSSTQVLTVDHQMGFKSHEDLVIFLTLVWRNRLTKLLSIICLLMKLVSSSGKLPVFNVSFICRVWQLFCLKLYIGVCLSILQWFVSDDDEFRVLWSFLSDLKMCVNTVCLRFSHEFTQFSQSFFFLEFRVKNVFRIKYLESFMYRFMKIYKYVQISVSFLWNKLQKKVIFARNR